MSKLQFDETQSRIQQKRVFSHRIMVALSLILLVFFLILGRMAYLQWLNHEQYYGLAEGNRISVVPIAPERGKIFDRHQNILVDNTPVFSLIFQREQIYDVARTLEQIQQLFPHIPQTIMEEFLTRLKKTPRHKSQRLPVTLDEKDAAVFAVNSYRFPGVSLSARLKRTYVHGSSAVHLLGYVGRLSQADLARIDPNRYRGVNVIGRAGIERQYEEQLHGFPGLKKVETNAQGRTLKTLDIIPAKSGQDLTLTIDIELQKYIENLLKDERASVVAIEPQTGEILAFVSTPGYDPNLFVDGISHENYNRLLHDPDKPLINRASRGQYPPGSTTKPFIGLGALELGVTTTSERIFDPGYFEFQDRRYRNWRREGHGWTDLHRSIVESVDTYYYKMSLDMGVDMLHDILAPFGFGQKTGIDLPGELSGILPSQEWKMRTHGKPWYRGETIITSIGQGYNLVTPLQLAKATAILANRGRIITPHLLKGLDVENEQQINIKNRANWEYVIDAMKDTVHTPAGTAWLAGRRHLTNKLQVAGKTGTAQVFSLNEAEYVEEDLEKRLHDHSLFIGFAPVTRPKIAISVLVENGGGGGRVAAPIGLQVINHYLNELE